jgi:2-polyprenyl-3-methyl-5-hydroxy-6-metoxy-1,4-benzoquinol methylase
VRAEDLVELMDDPHCDPARLHRTYRRFGVVNRIVAGWGAVYRTQVRPHLGQLGRPARVLDLGCGGGDVIVHLAKLAERDGLRAEWVGVDPDERAMKATKPRVHENVTFRLSDSSELLSAGERFDVVLSNHVLHHLSSDELIRFAHDSRALARGLVLHGDIVRHQLAYGLYAVGITPFAPGTFLRTDGMRSIRRSYRADELAAALGTGWTIESPAPFRLLAVARGQADD